MKFRDLMSLVPTSVSVLSCVKDQFIYGCTVSSLVSVNISDESPEVLFVLKKDSMIGSEIAKQGLFSINLLNFSQTQIAEKYANQREPDKFDDNNWDLSKQNFAQLVNARAIMNCHFNRKYNGQGADIYVGTVDSFMGNTETPGLIYESRQYGRFTLDKRN